MKGNVSQIRVIDSICPCLDKKSAAKGRLIALQVTEDEAILMHYDQEFQEWFIFGHLPNEDGDHSILIDGQPFCIDGYNGYAQVSAQTTVREMLEIYRMFGLEGFHPVRKGCFCNQT